jgi:hypothetical protein
VKRTATLASVVMLGIGLHAPAWAEHAWVLWADVDQVGGRFLAVSKSWSVVGSIDPREAKAK